MEAPQEHRRQAGIGYRHGGPLHPFNELDEHAYSDWVHRFIRRLSALFPDEPPHPLCAAADEWGHHWQQLSAEDAAEIAGMWWDRRTA